MYTKYMERIYTVDEVAEILRIKPYTVRHMFRDGRLSGFKVGKAWRIHEAALRDDIDRMTHGDSPKATRKRGASPAQSPEPSEGPKLEPEADRLDPPSPVASYGHLLVHSDQPGQEVFLDGMHRGPTTLSIKNVEVGNHRLEVGGAETMVAVSKDFQTRVHVRGGKMEIMTSPQTVALRGNGAKRKGAKDTAFRVRIILDNHTEYAGDFSLTLSRGGERKSSAIFVHHVEDLDGSGLSVVRKVGPLDRTELFDGVVHARPDDELVLTVSSQEGFRGKTQHTFTLTSDVTVCMKLAPAGVFRKREALEFFVSALDADVKGA